MGKRLIIKGADFSQVAIRTEKVYSELFADIDWSSHTSNNTNSMAKALYGRAVGDFDFSKTSGKKIVGVKVNVKVVNQGVAQVGVVRGFRNLAQPGQVVSVPNLMSITDVQDVHITETGVQTIMLDTPIILGANDWIGIGNLTNAPGSGNIPAFWNYAGHKICYVNGPLDSEQYANTIEDTTGKEQYTDFTGIDYLYEE